MNTALATPHGNPKLILFLTIFVAMLGLSVLFPVIAPLGRQLGFTANTHIGPKIPVKAFDTVLGALNGKRTDRGSRARPVPMLRTIKRKKNRLLLSQARK